MKLQLQNFHSYRHSPLPFRPKRYWFSSICRANIWTRDLPAILSEIHWQKANDAKLKLNFESLSEGKSVIMKHSIWWCNCQRYCLPLHWGKLWWGFFVDAKRSFLLLKRFITANSRRSSRHKPSFIHHQHEIILVLSNYRVLTGIWIMCWILNFGRAPKSSSQRV
jgi:hypothetical protein